MLVGCCVWFACVRVNVLLLFGVVCCFVCGCLVVFVFVCARLLNSFSMVVWFCLFGLMWFSLVFVCLCLRLPSIVFVWFWLLSFVFCVSFVVICLRVFGVGCWCVAVCV